MLQKILIAAGIAAGNAAYAVQSMRQLRKAVADLEKQQ